MVGCSKSTPKELITRSANMARKGDWISAYQLAKRACELDPKNVEAHLMRAITAERNSEVDTAIDAAQKAISLNPENFQAYYTLGRICSQNPRYFSQAKKALVNAKRLRNDDKNVMILLCNIVMKEELKSSFRYLAQLPKYKDFKVTAAYYNQVALSYLRIGQITTANKYFTVAANMGKNEPEIIFNAARFYKYYYKNQRRSASLYARYLTLTENSPVSPEFVKEARENSSIIQ
jgi:Flp pilus assembly protein TadD